MRKNWKLLLSKDSPTIKPLTILELFEQTNYENNNIIILNILLINWLNKTERY